MENWLLPANPGPGADGQAGLAVSEHVPPPPLGASEPFTECLDENWKHAGLGHMRS